MSRLVDPCEPASINAVWPIQPPRASLFSCTFPHMPGDGPAHAAEPHSYAIALHAGVGQTSRSPSGACISSLGACGETDYSYRGFMEVGVEGRV